MAFCKRSSYKSDSKMFHKELQSSVVDRSLGVQNSENFLDKNESFYKNFVFGVANGLQKYIIDFPLFLKSAKNLPIDIILEKTEDIGTIENPIEVNMFMYNLIKYAIMDDEDHQEVSEAALISISKLLKRNSIQILDLVVKTWIDPDDETTALIYQLPYMVERSKTVNQKRALLRCIAAMSSLMPKSEETFIKFFIDQLQISDQNLRSLKKTAASSASQIICTYPISEFSKQIMANLPFDIQDEELSKYCFKALMAQCNQGYFDLFDVPQLIDYACGCQNRTSYDAVYTLIAATNSSIEVCEDLLNYTSELSFLLHNMSPKIYICLLILNIVSKGPTFANPFAFLIDSLPELYFECEHYEKAPIIRTLCSIIINDHIDLIVEPHPAYDALLDGIYLDDDVIIIIIQTLINLHHYSEDFHQALLELSENDDDVISYYATSVLNQFFQESPQDDFDEY